MYELVKINENDYYIDCPSKVGIVNVGGSEAVLIDAGSDKAAAKKILRALEGEGLKLKAIYVTHSHADHIGGACYLQNATGCKIYAKGIECAFTKHPILEPAFLYGGMPFSELKHKFLLAEESYAEPLTEQVLPQGFTMVSLPGHCFDMVGFKTPDGSFYLADALSSEATLEKYRIGYIYDIKSYIDTLERISKEEAKVFIPSHAAVCESISDLAQYNIKITEENADVICELCSEGLGFEELLTKIFEKYGLTMSYEQYVLVGSALRSYLTYLKEEGRISAIVSASSLIWKKNGNGEI